MTYGYISTHHRMIFSLKNYLRCVIFYMSIFATRLPICMFFRYFFTHFKWSKPGLKQNCEAFLSPINQDFLESYQYIAVAYKEYAYTHIFSFQNALSCCHLQRFARCKFFFMYRSFLYRKCKT